MAKRVREEGTVKNVLILNLLTTTTVAPPSNASKWQMGFTSNSAFKGLTSERTCQEKNSQQVILK